MEFECESPPTAEVVHEPSALRDTPSSEAVSPVPNVHNEQCIDSTVDGGTTTTVDGQGTVGAHQNLASDRHNNFITDAWSGIVFARKRVSDCARLGIQKVSAIDGREHGTEEYGKVLRFLYTVPEHVQDQLDTRSAVSKAGMDTARTLFGSEGSESSVLKAKIETHLSGACQILAVGQRCADWFVLRQFRATGTNSRIVLLESSAFRTIIGLETTDAHNEMTCREWFEVFFKGWFSSKVSIEAMMMESANEDAF